MDSSGVFLEKPIIEQALKLSRLHLRCYKRLACLALADGILRWKIRPKHHFLDHTFREVALGFNPRAFQCFLDEDMMGRCARLAGMCHRALVAQRCMLRYFILLSHRWHLRTRCRP